jgi:hypothetical protein
MSGEDDRHYQQMDKRIDDTVKRLDAESQTNKEFRADTRARVHKYRGTVGTMALSAAGQERDIRELQDLANRLEKTTADLASKLANELAVSLRDINNAANLQQVTIENTVDDLANIAKDFKEALGQEGWVLQRLQGQDERWSRIYFLIIGFLISVIGLTISLWLNSGGQKP